MTRRLPSSPPPMTENLLFCNWCAEGALLLRKIVLSAAICDRFWPRRCCKARKKLEEYHFASWGVMKKQTIHDQSSDLLASNFKTVAFLDPTACRLGNSVCFLGSPHSLHLLLFLSLDFSLEDLQKFLFS